MRAAAIYSLIGTARPNDFDPQTRLHQLLPWHWRVERQISIAASVNPKSYT